MALTELKYHYVYRITKALTGKSKSKEHRNKLSLSRIGKVFGKRPPYKEHTCPHCGKTGRGGIIKRWHFDNCKFKMKAS